MKSSSAPHTLLAETRHRMAVNCRLLDPWWTLSGGADEDGAGKLILSVHDRLERGDRETVHRVRQVDLARSGRECDRRPYRWYGRHALGTPAVFPTSESYAFSANRWRRGLARPVSMS